jgi:hypothetical protein
LAVALPFAPLAKPLSRSPLVRSPTVIAGEWQWLVRQDGRDVKEGAAPSADDAKQEAETVALGLLDPAPWISENRPRRSGFARSPGQVKPGRLPRC